MRASDIEIIPVPGCPPNSIFLFPKTIDAQEGESDFQAIMRAALEGKITHIKNIGAEAPVQGTEGKG